MKKFVISCFVLAVAASAQASWLWWQVDTQATMQNTGATYSFGTDYNAGKVYAVDGNGEVTTLAMADGETGETVAEAIRVGDTETWAVNLSQLAGDLSAYSFYIEYVNYQSSADTQVAISNRQSYQTLVNNKSISDTMSMVPQAAVWHGGGMNAPEPTSAMLMLMGVAGLALRRKQRKIA